MFNNNSWKGYFIKNKNNWIYSELNTQYYRNVYDRGCKYKTKRKNQVKI